MKMTKTKLREIIRQSIMEEREYDKYFKGMLAKYGVQSPADLSDDEKAKFFDEVDKGWKAKNEELTGNQHKLDVDGDGEIDASDLAALRAGKKKVESVNESKLDFSKVKKSDKLIGKFPPYKEYEVISSNGKNSIIAKDLKNGNRIEINSVNNYKLKESVNEDDDKVWVVTKNKGQAYQISKKAYDRNKDRYYLAGNKLQANKYAKQVRDGKKNEAIHEASTYKVNDEIPYNDTTLKKIYSMGYGASVIATGGGYSDTIEFGDNMKDAKYVKNVLDKNKLDVVINNAKKAVKHAIEPALKRKGRKLIIKVNELPVKLEGVSINESNYDLMFGKMGNGITVSNKKVTDPNTKDYKFIAHISDSGKIDWKDKEAQKNATVRREVEKKAKSMNESDDCGCGSSKINEGNAFGMAVTKAKQEGKKEFEFNGKIYKVKKGSYEKNKAAKESVNESVSVFDERHFGKKGIIIMIDDGGKKVSAIFKDKKNADKYNRNNPSDVKKLLDLAKKTPYPKAIDESINESTKFYAFFNGKKHEIEGTSLWDAKQKAITKLKVPKSKVGLLAIVNASDHNKGSFKFD